MTSAENRAMGRAAAILLVAGLIRVAHEARQPPPAVLPDKPDALPRLIEETRALREEMERRRTPLSGGETVDPNRDDAPELDRLPGVGPSAADAIVAARDSGRIFRRPEDLLDVRGIGPTTLEKIRPWLDLERVPVVRPGPRGAGSSPGGAAGGWPLARTPDPGAAVPLLPLGGAPSADAAVPPVDLNRATAAELEALPGVGPALAARIVALRAEKGRFTSADELLEVRGIGEATLARIRPRVTVGGR